MFDLVLSESIEQFIYFACLRKLRIFVIKKFS